MFYILCGVIGLIVGIVLTIICLEIKSVGVLRVDSSDSTSNPFLFLEFKRVPSNLNSRKYVLLKVNTKSYISQD